MNASSRNSARSRRSMDQETGDSAAGIHEPGMRGCSSTSSSRLLAVADDAYGFLFPQPRRFPRCHRRRNLPPREDSDSRTNGAPPRRHHPWPHTPKDLPRRRRPSGGAPPAAGGAATGGPPAATGTGGVGAGTTVSRSRAGLHYPLAAPACPAPPAILFSALRPPCSLSVLSSSPLRLPSALRRVGALPIASSGAATISLSVCLSLSLFTCINHQVVSFHLISSHIQIPKENATCSILPPFW